jgi:hypothetical protein
MSINDMWIAADAANEKIQKILGLKRRIILSSVVGDTHRAEVRAAGGKGKILAYVALGENSIPIVNTLERVIPGGLTVRVFGK